MSARSTEEVFESDEIPIIADVQDQFTKNDVKDLENIELIHLDFDTAKKRFDGKVLNCRDVDFSDSIARKRQRGYGSTGYVLEVVGKGYDGNETAEQKFNRLTYELNELTEQIKDGTVEPVGLLCESSLGQMMDELKGIKVNGSAAADTESSKKSDGNKDEKTSANLDQNTASRVLSIEHRMRRIEEMLGPIDTSKQPIVDAVEDLKFRTDALNPAYIDGVEMKLNAVLTKMEQVEEKRTRSGDGELEEKVNELLALMTKWDSTCSSLPSTLKKIQALHRLQEQAQHFSSRLSQLVGTKEQIEKTVQSSKADILDLQTRSRDDMASLLKKLSHLDERVQALGK